MRYIPIFAVLILTSLLSACGTGSLLGKAGQYSCLGNPTPSAQMECEQRAKEDRVAQEKEILRNKAEVKAKADAEIQAQASQGRGVAGDASGEAKSDSADATQADTKKKSSLCFKRAATGEMVCPN